MHAVVIDDVAYLPLTTNVYKAYVPMHDFLCNWVQFIFLSLKFAALNEEGFV